MKQTATPEKVREAYLALELQGEKPSVRKIVALVGGSNSTITPLIRQFEERRRKENEFSYGMSQAFRQAYIDDMIAVTGKAKSELNTALNSALEHEQELLAQLGQMEEEIYSLQTHIESATTSAEAKSQEYENRLSACKQQLVDLGLQQQRSEQDKLDLQEKMANISSELTEKSLILSQSQETNQSLSQENFALQQKNSEQRELIIELKKQVEIAEDRLDSAQDRLQEFREENDRTNKKLEEERGLHTQVQIEYVRLETTMKERQKELNEYSQ